MTFSERAQFILKNNPCSFRTSGFGTACQTILLAQTDSRRSRCRDSAICLAFFIRCLSAIAVIAQRRFTSRERQHHEEDRKSQTGSSLKAKPSQIRVWNERDNAMCEAYLSALGLFSSHRHQFPDDSGNLPRRTCAPMPRQRRSKRATGTASSCADCAGHVTLALPRSLA